MAKSALNILSLIILLAQPLFTTTSSSAVGAMVGGRREVKNVESNEEIQDLGKFCVQQYNLQLQKRGSQGGAQLVDFSKVVEAQTQVVAGIKYYLKISTSGGLYDAEVVVKPWLRAKEMLTFAPSLHSTRNYK